MRTFMCRSAIVLALVASVGVPAVTRAGEVDWPPAQRAGDRFFSILRRKRPDSHPAGPNQIEHPRVIDQRLSLP